MERLSAYAGSKVLVTGNTGFKGSWISLWLRELGAQVTGLSIDIPSQPALFEQVDAGAKIKTSWVDIADYQNVLETLEKHRPDYVFHLAAQPIVGRALENPLETWRTNCLGTATLLQAITDSSVNDLAVIIITSDKVYRNEEWVWGYRENDALGGFEPYGLSKAAAEFAFESFVKSGVLNPKKCRAASVRAGNVIGGGDWAQGRIVPDAARAAKGKFVLEVRNPQSTRPWQHVLEPLFGYLLVGLRLKNSAELHGESYNFGPEPGENYSVHQLLKGLEKYLDFSWAVKSPQADSESHGMRESTLLALSSEKAASGLGWRPNLSFSDTLEWTARWYANWLKGMDPLDITLRDIREYMERASDGY